MDNNETLVVIIIIIGFFYMLWDTGDRSKRTLEAIAKEKLQKKKAEQATKIAKKEAEEAEAKEKAEVARLEEKALEVARLEEEEMELEIARQEKEAADLVIAEENFKLRLSTLKTNLPFHTSKKTPSAELADHDKGMWDDVTKLVKEQDSKKATLYFVKIKSLMDDNEYFKIGMTTVGVRARFKKSTQVELLETLCSFDTELYKAAYLEYHFLREFRLYDGLVGSLGELRPEVGFSGYTEVVRSNSVSKISEFFGELDVYNEL